MSQRQNDGIEIRSRLQMFESLSVNYKASYRRSRLPTCRYYFLSYFLIGLLHQCGCDHFLTIVDQRYIVDPLRGRYGTSGKHC